MIKIHEKYNEKRFTLYIYNGNAILIISRTAPHFQVPPRVCASLPRRHINIGLKLIEDFFLNYIAVMVY